MPKRPQNYHRPKTLAEALHLLEQPDTAPLGGGTRLLTDDIQVSSVVDLQDLGMAEIDLLEHQLHIGAMARLVSIEESTEITATAAEILKKAVHLSGPNTFRHAATLGGVIGSREPDSELLALLLTLDARLMLVNLHGVAEMPLADYLAADERPQDLIKEIIIPFNEGGGALERVARTPADSPIVSVVAWQPLDAPVRLAATGISTRPIRLYDAETAEDKIAAAQAAVTHPGDFRGSQEYRREMVGVLVQRVLAELNGG